MAMAVAVGGFSAGQADRLRRAMGAWRKRGTLNEMGRDLVEGMVSRGIERRYAEQIFAQILGFGEYGFPESHAASFALLVYVSGWLRCHHVAAFTAALINSQPMGFYSPRALLADAQRHGIEVRPVCVEHSEWDCTLEATESGAAAIRCGLRLVRGLGEDDADALLAARAQSPFVGVADLARRSMLDRGALQALAESDAFASLGIERRRAAWILQGLWTELPLFAGVERREPSPQLPPESPSESLQADFRTVGLSVSTHPVSLIRPLLDARRCRRLAVLTSLESGAYVRIAGLVSSRQRPGTASGVVFMTLEDETAMANLVIWPRTWERFRRLARSAALLGVDGRLQRQGEAASVLVERFWPVPRSTQETGLETLPVRSRDFH